MRFLSLGLVALATLSWPVLAAGAGINTLQEGDVLGGVTWEEAPDFLVRCAAGQFLVGLDIEKGLFAAHVSDNRYLPPAKAGIADVHILCAPAVAPAVAGPVVRVDLDRPGSTLGVNEVRLVCPGATPFVTSLQLHLQPLEPQEIPDGMPVFAIALFCGLVDRPQGRDSPGPSHWSNPEETGRSLSRKCPGQSVAVGIFGAHSPMKHQANRFDDPPPHVLHLVCGQSHLSPGAAVRPAARVLSSGHTASAPLPICEAARQARARNSPAAPGLEAQCHAVTPGAQIQLDDGMIAPDFEALAARGAELVDEDPLAGELRAAQEDDAARRGFMIGMAAAEGQTADGPGKQRMQGLMDGYEKPGFVAGVRFSIDRNRNAEAAATGAAIALADPEVGMARDADDDAFYRLGFDIATGIFGDPALGAQGNTETGPGSLGIRSALTWDAQRGFDAALALHLGRDYGR